MSWHILTSEYPPDVGGVSDFTGEVAVALARAGDDVHVWCPPSRAPRDQPGVHVHTELGRCGPPDLRRVAAALDAFPKPRRLFVQWVPHGYGWHSMNVWFCLWLAGRASIGDRVEVMVHEPFLELKRGPLRHVVMAVVHRAMTIVLMHAASKVWVSTPSWEPVLRPYALGRRVSIEWLPVPGHVAPRASGPPVRKRFVVGSEALVGHFGSYGPHVSALLEGRLGGILDSPARPSCLLIGGGSELFRRDLIARHPAWGSRVKATGYVPPSELPGYLEACDLVLQPYPDGITFRRTSAMACLALGIPVVTTSGRLTEPLWEASGAVRLAPVSSPDAFVSAAIRMLEDREERARLARLGLSLYRARFAIDRVVAALRPLQSHHRDGLPERPTLPAARRDHALGRGEA